MSRTPAALVDEAAGLVAVDPRRCEAVARVALAVARSSSDLVSQARAERLIGLAKLHQGSSGVLTHLRRATRVAQLSAVAAVEGEARLTLAATLAAFGSPRAALRELERALPLADNPARADAQHGVILYSLGRLDEAVDRLTHALPALVGQDEQDWVLAALINRGAVHLARGDGRAAAVDLSEAVAIARKLGNDLDAGYASANLAHAHTLTGNVPDALSVLSDAEGLLRTAGAGVASLLSLRAELLMSVRLLREAREAAETALAEFREEGHGNGVADMLLLLAQVCARGEDLVPAAEYARAARRAFLRQGRLTLAALATTWLAAAGGRVTPSAMEAAVRTVAEAGWHAAEVEARLVAARVVAPRSAELHLAGAAELRRGQRSADVRARAWYAEGLHRLRLGSPSGAARAAARGLEILDLHHASLPATDLRAFAAAHRTQLVDLGLGTVVGHGNPRRVFAWAERGRAVNLLRAPVRPVSDPVVAERIAAARAVVREMYEARATGADARTVSRLRARQVRLEREVRDLVRRRGTVVGASAAKPAPAAEVAAALGDRALVEYVVHDGALHAVTLVDRRCRLHHLGDVATVAGLVERVPFAVQRMIRAARSPGGASAAQTLLADAGRRLDALLLEPLRETAGRDLVVVPTGALQATAWSVLPSCHGRPVTVAPSATVWLAASSRPAATGPAVVAAGPRLASAAQEARAVADLYGVDPLVDPDATVGAVSAALPGASVAHLATHGRLSAENPLFSHLLLSDGPLVVYDLERLESLPHTVVLAACDSGRHVAPAGDELLGLGAAFLAGGTAQLVASVVPVPDAETATLMTALHEGLVAGLPPAVALARAQVWLAGAGPVAAATAAGFVCVGAGYVPVRVTSD